MSFAIVGVLATLLVVLALNWPRFRAMGWSQVGRMLLIWLGIIVGLGLVLRLLGY